MHDKLKTGCTSKARANREASKEALCEDQGIEFHHWSPGNIMHSYNTR